MRSGTYVKQLEGYRAFIPAPLPPSPPLSMVGEMMRLFEKPLINVRLVEQHLQCAFITAARLLEQFAELGIVAEVTGEQRNRRYEYFPYLKLFEPLGIFRYPRKGKSESKA